MGSSDTKGFTLIEMLVVTVLFAGLAVLVGNMIAISMKGARKSESALKVRVELENAASVFERSIRGAKRGSVNCTSNQVSFIDQDDLPIVFTCSPLKKDGVEIIDSSKINLRVCDFDCSSIAAGVISINLSGVRSDFVNTEGDIATVSARVVLRNY